MLDLTVEEQRALLRVRCRWCLASPGQFCESTVPKRRRGWGGAPTLIPGFAHDTRWIDAGLREEVSCGS